MEPLTERLHIRINKEDVRNIALILEKYPFLRSASQAIRFSLDLAANARTGDDLDHPS